MAKQEIHCHIHGITAGFGGQDNPRCLRCAQRHAQARKEGIDVRDLLRKDLKEAKNR